MDYLHHKTLLQHEVHEMWIKKYGKVVGYFNGASPYVLVADTDIIRKICISNASTFINRAPGAVETEPFASCLVCYKDDDWRRVRRITSPMFTMAKVSSNKFTEMIYDCVNTLLNNLSEEDTKNGPFVVDVHDRMERFSMHVISRSSLGLNENWYEKNNEFLMATREYFETAYNFLVEFATMFPSRLLSAIFMFITRYLTAGKMTDIIVDHLKKKISIFISKQERGEDQAEKSQLLIALLECLGKGKITQQELIANANLLILAGYETTACGLTYTLYFLAKYPEIQSRLREELAKDGCNSQYLQQVWSESLRLFPPVTQFITRNTAHTIVIDGYTFEKGVNVILPTWNVHHDEQIWPDSFTFDPDRFEHPESIPPETFFPFGLGPRICLGMKIADWEAKILITTLINKYRIEFCEETMDPIVFKCPSVTIHPRDPVKLRFIPIEK